MKNVTTMKTIIIMIISYPIIIFWGSAGGFSICCGSDPFICSDLSRVSFFFFNLSSSSTGLTSLGSNFCKLLVDVTICTRPVHKNIFLEFPEKGSFVVHGDRLTNVRVLCRCYCLLSPHDWIQCPSCGFPLCSQVLPLILFNPKCHLITSSNSEV